MFEVGNLRGGGLGPLPEKPMPHTASGCLGDCIHCDQICEGPGREQSLQPNWNTSSSRGASRANFCPSFWSMKSFLKLGPGHGLTKFAAVGRSWVLWSQTWEPLEAADGWSMFSDP